jgi:hypothetical protein
MNAFPLELSGGEQQRGAIARATAEGHSLRAFAPQDVELMPKYKDFGFQCSPRAEQPDQAAPDQPAKIAHRWNYQPIRGRQSAVWVCGRDTHRHVLRIEGKMLDGIADNERIRLAALLASCVANLSKATGKVLRMPALPANVRYRQ